MTEKHLLIMLACCLVPLAALAAITVFNIPADTVVYFGILLLCPLLHFAMMRNMPHEHAEHGAHSPEAHTWKWPRAKNRNRLADQTGTWQRRACHRADRHCYPACRIVFLVPTRILLARRIACIKNRQGRQYCLPVFR